MTSIPTPSGRTALTSTTQGSGTLGRVAVRELADAGFAVTVFTREGSASTVPPGVALRVVDYASVESLTAALEGQDALVSVIGTVAVAGQRPLVDAAVAAGVRRFIPSEYGINTRFLGKEPIGTIVQGKIQALNYAHEKSRQNPSFTWTAISTGFFFDWVRFHFTLLRATTQGAILIPRPPPHIRVLNTDLLVWTRPQG